MIVDARAQTNEAMTELLEKLRRAVTNAAAALGATAEVTRKNSLTPAVRISTTLLINIPISKLLTSVSAQLQLRACIIRICS